MFRYYFCDVFMLYSRWKCCKEREGAGGRILNNNKKHKEPERATDNDLFSLAAAERMEMESLEIYYF
jgi:hypothetical protein